MIATASAGRNFAVGQQLLAFMEAGLFVGPMHLAVAAIRKIDEPRFLDFDHARPAVIETAVVLSNDAIVIGGFA